MTQTPETKTPTRAEALAEKFSGIEPHVYVNDRKLSKEEVETIRATLSTDAPIVEGLDEDEIAEYLAGVAGWSWQTMDANDVDGFRKLARLYAQGRTQAVPDEENLYLRQEAFGLVRKGLSDNSTGGERSVAMSALKCIESELSAAPPSSAVKEGAE